MNAFLFLLGCLVLIDGALNVLYCALKKIDYPISRFFQFGRLARAVIGLVIMTFAVMFAGGP